MGDNHDFTISWKTCLKLVVSVAIVFLFVHYWASVEGLVGALLAGCLALIAGLVIGYVLNIPLRFFERVLPGPTGDGTRNRILSFLLTLVCAIIVVLFVGIIVIPNLIESIITLVQRTPGFIQSITENQAIASFIPPQLIEGLKSIDWEAAINSAVAWLQSGVTSSLPQVVSIFGQVGAWFMGIIFSFWFLNEKDRLARGIHTVVQTYLGKGVDEKFKRVLCIADESFHAYIVAQSLEGVAFGTLVAIVCAIAGIPGALGLGALVGFMSLIPMIGALVGAVLGAIIIFAISWEKALIFLIIFFVVQQIEQNFFYPNIVTKRVGLWGMWPLVGITIGVAIWGFPGAFVGVPILAALFRILRDDVKRRRELPEDESSPMEKLHESLAD